jgi:Protein of unknown function (DUF3047)
VKAAALLLLALSAPAALAQAGLFSATGLDGWTERTFEGKQPTRYRLIRDSGVQVLQADCQASASGWIRKQKIDLERTPVLRWRWKVERVYPDVREREKKGDDFPARVYVVLGSGQMLSRTRTLVYVWASTEPQGRDWPSAYTRQAHMVALRSGASGAGQWHEERRNVRADFKRYFGIDIAAADGVAVMTDCDDAGGSMRAWYGDVRFGAS